MLSSIYYQNSLKNWLISICILAGAILLNFILMLLNKYVFIKIASKSKSNFDDDLLKSLQAPILFGIILFSFYIAEKRLNIDPDVHKYFAIAYKILSVLNITWFCARFFKVIFDNYTTKREEKLSKTTKKSDSKFYPLIRRSLLIVIWCLGVVMALNNAGISVATLLATLGIGGIAFALAAQDTIKNIFGGITIFSDKPFMIGDRIKVNGSDGVVRDIGLRSTKIMTLDNRLLTIPNNQLVDAAIENVSSEPSRKVASVLGLTYQTNPDKVNIALDILKDIHLNVPGVSKKDIVASFTDFAASSLNITFVYYIKKDADIYDTTNAANLYVLKAFNDNNIDFAYQTIKIEK